MPKNKNATDRFQIINGCLQRGNIPYSIEKLIERIHEETGYKISERTLRGDIEFMKMIWNPPFRAEHRTYRYTEKFSINNIPLTDEELELLTFVSTLLEQFRDTEELYRLKDSIQKMVRSMRVRLGLNHLDLYNFIEFEKGYFSGFELLQPLIKTIKYNKVISFDYKDFYERDWTTYIVHPFLLKEYRKRWYLIGLDDNDAEIISFSLDRMSNLRQAEGLKFRKKKINNEELFKHSVGIRRSKSVPEKVKLKFSKLQADYLRTLKFHPSQKELEEGEDFVIMQFEVWITPELIMQILAWSNEVEVLEPLSLRNEVAGMLRVATGKYVRD